MIDVLLSVAQPSSVMTLIADRVYQSSEGSCRAVAFDRGKLYFTSGYDLYVAREGRVKTLRLPAPARDCNALGLYAGGLAVDVAFKDGTRVYELDEQGYRPVTPLAAGLSGTGAAGRFIVGTGLSAGRPNAYRWAGRWLRLPDYGNGSEARSVTADGTVFGEVARGKDTLACFWDHNDALHLLPIGSGLDNGVAIGVSSTTVLGFGGYAAERTGDIQNYRYSVLWRKGQPARLYPKFEGRSPAKGFYAIAGTIGNDLYGTLTPASGGPSFSRGVLIRKGHASAIRVKFKNKDYVLSRIDIVDGRMVLASGYLDDKGKRYVGAVILFHAPAPT